MEYFQNPQGSLFKLTRGEYDFIVDMIREENPVAVTTSIDAYTKSDFLDDVYMTEKRYENLVAVLQNKKNIILHKVLPALVRPSLQDVWLGPLWVKKMIVV